MILDKIIDLELALLKRNRIPRKILINITSYNLLVKELDSTTYLEYVHNMEIVITNSTQLVIV